MKAKFFDQTKLFLKAYFCEKGDFMTIKNILKKDQENGHLE